MRAGIKLAVFLCFCLIVLLSAPMAGSAADKFTLNIISAWPKPMPTVDFFIKDFIAHTQKAADEKYPGELKLRYKGGPEVVPTSEQIIAVGKGMVDMVYTSMTYYVSKMPELDMMNLTPMMPWEEDKVGLTAYLDELHNKKSNTHFLVRNGTGITFQFGLNKMVKSLDDFKGMSIRTNQTTLQLVKALGANPVQMPPMDLYTAMERGVVQAHVTPAYMFRTFGVDKITKYLLFPGFFNTNNVIIINLDTWNKLPKHLQDLLTEQGQIHAKSMHQFNYDLEKAELDLYKSQGMQFIELSKEETAKYLKLADDSLAEVVLKKAPVEGQKILDFIRMKP